MADSASVYKICPHCGQSVSVAAKYCPSCGAPFAEESADFVAYERYTQPQQPAAPASPQQSPAPQDAPVYRAVESPTAERTIAQAASGGTNAPPPMGGKSAGPDGGRRRNPLITAVAAVLLIAVVAAGVVMAFHLGLLGGKNTDPMTLAQEDYDAQQYDDAITQLQQMLQDGTGTAETYDLMARSFEATDQLQDAADTYLKGYQATQDGTLKQSAIDAYLRLGDLAKSQGDPAAAREYYNTVLERLDTNNSTAINALSTLRSSENAAAVSPGPSTQVSPPSPSPSGASGNGRLVVEREEAVSATPAPSPSPEPTPTPEPSEEPSPEPTPAPTPSPEPTPTPTPTPPPAPVTFTLDGHTYELVKSDCTWWTARDAALNAGGHLVTISSQEEYDRCAALAQANDVVLVRIGATRGDWESGVWNNSEPFSFSCWLPGEPSGGDEDCLCMLNVGGAWYYNDSTNTVSEYPGKKGYIIEYDG